jgi:hypothetical protein
MTIKNIFMAAALAALASTVAAQSFPAKPVRILVGFGAGGATDIVARTLAQSLTADWKQNVLVENRAGASGMIAAEMTAKAPPDGYTLMITPQTSLAVAPALRQGAVRHHARLHADHADRLHAAADGGAPVVSGEKLQRVHCAGQKEQGTDHLRLRRCRFFAAYGR